MLVHILIFIIILFLYLHITDQYKKGEDLEVYEMDYIDNPELQEVCQVKQPIVFDSPKVGFFEKMKNTVEVHYGSYEVHVKDTVDYANSKDTVDSIVLPFQSTQNLMMTDTEGHYFSEGNGEFLEETGLIALYREMDPLLKPTYIVHTQTDLWFGSKNAATPLRYHTHFRQFLCVISGRLRLKVSPWKSSKFLNPIKDYDAYDFRSQYDPWNTSNADSPLRFLDIEAGPGQIVYIPPYWWYSVKFVGDALTYVSSVTYHSPMNLLAHSYDLGMYFLQQQNIRKTYAKAMAAPSLEKEGPSTEVPSSPDSTPKENTMNLTQHLPTS